MFFKFGIKRNMKEKSKTLKHEREIRYFETNFGRRVQKDAPGPVSPLRVRIFGVWALGASFGPVFGVFRRSKETVLERMVQKDAPGPVSHLRVRIFGVWAPEACFGPVLGVF